MTHTNNKIIHTYGIPCDVLACVYFVYYLSQGKHSLPQTFIIFYGKGIRNILWVILKCRVYYHYLQSPCCARHNLNRVWTNHLSSHTVLVFCSHAAKDTTTTMFQALRRGRCILRSLKQCCASHIRSKSKTPGMDWSPNNLKEDSGAKEAQVERSPVRRNPYVHVSAPSPDSYNRGHPVANWSCGWFS